MRKGIYFLVAVMLAIINVNAQEKIAKWDVFEITLKGSSLGNPFINTQLVAEFKNGNKIVKPEGFYDGDGVYKIRFMPEVEGTWTYTTSSNQSELDKKEGSFVCIPAKQHVHGPVGVRNTYHFAYADGSPFFPFGTTIYEWSFQERARKDQTIATLKKAPFNKVRMLAIPPYKSTYIEGPNKLSVFPFVGTEKSNFDFSRFNPAYFKMLEQDITQLADIGIQADFILFRPYDKGKWGFDTMDDATNIRYLKYMVARFGAYHNIWWSLCNEDSFIKHLSEEDWDRYFQVVQKADPYAHLRSIHNADRVYDYGKPWVTHVSLQYYNVVKSPWGTSLLRDLYKKPVVNDEINYEGTSDRRWGQLDGEEMVFRFWNAYIGGGYATHGETLPSWIGDGGTLVGKSPARIDFLRRIVEDGPQEGLEPIDHFYETNIAGKAGSYYLIYFGKDTPKEWIFKLPKAELSDGMRFTAEVIDTWNMTVKPVDGVFETKRLNGYSFLDSKKAKVKLNGKPYMAIKLMLVDGTKTPKGSKSKGNELNEDMP